MLEFAKAGAVLNSTAAPLGVLFGDNAKALGEVQGDIGQAYTGRLYAQQGAVKVLLKQWDFEVVTPPRFELDPASGQPKKDELAQLMEELRCAAASPALSEVSRPLVNSGI